MVFPDIPSEHTGNPELNPSEHTGERRANSSEHTGAATPRRYSPLRTYGCDVQPFPQKIRVRSCRKILNPSEHTGAAEAISAFHPQNIRVTGVPFRFVGNDDKYPVLPSEHTGRRTARTLTFPQNIRVKAAGATEHRPRQPALPAPRPPWPAWQNAPTVGRPASRSEPLPPDGHAPRP